MSKKRGDFTLYQRPPSKIWWARKRRKGKDFRISLDTEDKGLGRERAEKWIKELIASDWGEKPAMTFSDAMLRYAEERFSSLGDGGKRYATSIEHLSAHLGDVETKTKGASRKVPLLDRSYEFLKHAEKKSLTVFATVGGNAYSRNSPTIWEALQKAARKAGIENLTPHDLRRTCGCRLLQDYKVSMEVVSRWLGHSSVRVTERHYAFLEVEQLHQAVEEGRENVVRIAEMRAKLKAAGHK